MRVTVQGEVMIIHHQKNGKILKKKFKENLVTAYLPYGR
jgi:hypothetical protein